MHIYVVKTGNRVVTRFDFAVFHFNIVAAAVMHTVVTAENGKIFGNYIFTVRYAVRPVARMPNGVTRKTKIFAKLHADSVRAAIIFLAAGTIAVLTVNNRAFLAYDFNIFRVHNSD